MYKERIYKFPYVIEKNSMYPQFMNIVHDIRTALEKIRNKGYYQLITKSLFNV